MSKIGKQTEHFSQAIQWKVSQNLEFSQQIQILEQKLNSLQNENNQLSKLLKQEKNSNEKLLSKNRSLEQSDQLLLSENDDLKNRLKFFENQNNLVSSQLKDLKDHVFQQQKENESAKKGIENNLKLKKQLQIKLNQTDKKYRGETEHNTELSSLNRELNMNYHLFNWNLRIFE
jgi:chromosome segregation ATPase